MLAQLLKNLYICTFLFVLRQKQEVVTQTAEQVGDTGKKNKIKGRPGRPTSHDNKAIPHSPKELRQRCSPSHTEERQRGGKRKQNINRVPHSPLRYRYKNQGRQIVCASSQSASSPLNHSAGSVVCRRGDGGGCLVICPLHTFINRNYVTEFFPSMNYRQPTSTPTVQKLAERPNKFLNSKYSSEVITSS